MNDLKFAFRQLLKHPGFTAVAMLTLALGIGATTAIVSVLNTAVLDPLPVRHSGQLVQLGNVRQELGWRPGINPLALRDLRRQTDLFARVVAYDWDSLTLNSEDFPQLLRGIRATREFFGLWNLRPLLGRPFIFDEGQPGKDDALVISHRLWQNQFGGDPAIIGRTIPFREGPMTVVGVMPPHFSFPQAEYEYWRPFEGPELNADDYLPNTQAIAEMRPGVEPLQVQAFLNVLTKRQAQDFDAGGVFPWVFQARDLREMFSTLEVRRVLGLLLGAIIFVLLIAAANVANLQLTHTETRQQELAVRAALGAGRVRVFRQLLTESLLLAVLGGAAGLGVTALGLDLLQHLLPADLPRLKPIVVNSGVLSLAAGVTLVPGVLFGLVPAVRGWQPGLNDVLKLGAATTTRARGKLSGALIAGQLALSLMLLAGAGLMIRSVVGLLRVNPGLDPRHVVRVYPSTLEVERRGFSPDPVLNKAPDAAIAFFEDARQRIAAIPGVDGVGVGFEGRETEILTTPGSRPARAMKYWIGVGEYDPLRVLRVPLKQGRWLDRSDLRKGVRSVLVNETAVRQLWPGEVAVGKLLWAKEGDLEAAYQVAGVVGDTRDYSRHVAPQPVIYRALQNEPGVDTTPKFLVVRTAVDPFALYKPIGQALKSAGADLRMPEFYNLDEMLRTRMAGHRAVMLYLTIFAGVGLFLSAVGLYGVLAYRVARRTREIGVRMALGAQIADVMRVVLNQGLKLVAIGGGLGITAALATARVLRAYLFGVSSTDPVTFIAVALLLAAVALFACWLPARRAARVDPMQALRYE